MSTPKTGRDDVQNHTEQQTPHGLFRKGASSCPASPLQSAKPDRTADFAAVRHLAESYGVDLLPLEMGFTPLKTQVAAKPAQRLSTADSTADLPNTPEVNDNTAAAGARDLEQAFSAAVKTPRDLEPATHIANDAQDSLQEPSTGTAAGTAAASMQGAAVQLQEASSGLSGYPIDVDGSGSEVHTESPSGMAAFEEGSDGYCLYLDEERVPVEERVAQLEEERDTLVDRLLATTAALHESEARNRQSEASQSQVQALLEQLQELLRRAEVERDRAKLQLKRHRVSNSQFMFPVSSPDPHANVQAEPAFVLASAGPAPAGGTLPGLPTGLLARPASKKYKVSAGGSSSAAGTRAVSRDLFSRGSSGENATATAAKAPADASEASAGAAPPADGCSSGEASTGASATAGPAASDSLVAAVAGAGSSVAAVGLAAWGSQRSSQDSSCSSSDAVSPTGGLEAAITLTPSTDEARPPVSSVVRGFEALLHRQRGSKGSSSPGQGSSGGRSRELGLTARSSGNGSRSASPMTSMGGADRPAAPDAAPAAEADLPAVAALLETAAPPAAPPAAPAAAAADADGDAPASPAAGPADVDEDTAAAGDVASEDGSSSLSSEAHRRTYADAAVAGATAERMRHRSGAGHRQQNPSRTPGASSSVGSGSAVSTPTAAALCNTPPLGSHMLDSSCFSEEEESLMSWGGASLSAGGAQQPHSRTASSRGGGVYKPPAQAPGRAASAGGRAELLPGVKRDRSSSPAASSTSVQEQSGMQQGVVSPSVSQGSPGSAFGSLFSCELGSPSGSMTKGPASSPGAVSTAGNASSSRGKQRCASRLGATSSPGTAVSVELNPAGVPRSASSSKQGKGPSASNKQRKGQSEQQSSRSACESKSNGGASSHASSGGSKQKSPGQSTSKPAAAAVLQKAPSPAVSSANKQSSKKAAAASQVQHSTGSASGINARSAANGRMQPLLLLVAVLVVALGCAAAVYLWFGYQAKVTVLQEQLQQLQKELTDRTMQCSSDVSQANPGGDA